MPPRLLLILAATALAPSIFARAAELPPGYTEELLATQSANSEVLIPGGKQVVWREKRGQLWTMVVNGVAGKEYDNIGPSIFSDDGRQMAYIIQKGGGAVVVHNGRESAVFQQVAGVHFSGDGQHIGYMAADGTGMRLFLDGRPLEPTAVASGSTGLWLNADGSRWAYWCDDGIVVDGQLRPQHKSRSNGERLNSIPQFSPDGRRLAYRVMQGAKTLVVIDDREGQPYESATNPIFSADSKHVGYVGIRGRRAFVVIDGIEGPPQLKILGAGIVFSPDSTHFAYFGLPQNIPYHWVPKSTDPKRGSGMFLLGGKLDDVVQALQGPPMEILSARSEIIAGPIWSAEGAHWAYTRPEGTGTAVVVDGTASPRYEAVAPLALDREGRPFFAVRRGKKWTMMRGEQPIGKTMDELWAVATSSDGRHAAWMGQRGDKQFAATPAGEGKSYDLITMPTFNAEGTVFSYIARDGNRFLRITQPVSSAGETK